jgi:hypothetical protein
VQRFGSGVREDYARATGRVPEVFVCEPSAAAVAFSETW